KLGLKGTTFLLASSTGTTAGAASLTDQALQPVLAQASAYWRAAGVAPQSLEALSHLTVYVADLPDNQLGLEDDGQIWIDQNAAGWGWTLGGSPAQGRMDLATVVTHEIGHALGFGHSDLGVMEAALTPGARLVPESGPLAATSATASTPLAAASPFSV